MELLLNKVYTDGKDRSADTSIILHNQGQVLSSKYTGSAWVRIRFTTERKGIAIAL